MPISYTIHRDRGLLVTRFTHPVTDEEFVDAYRAIFSDPGPAVPTRELVDLRNAGSFSASKAALLRVDELTRRRFGDEGTALRTAVVAPTDLGFGLARMYGAYASDGPEEVSVHRTLDDALRWLGVEDIPVDEIHEDR